MSKGQYINGAWVKSNNKSENQEFNSTNPATNEIIWVGNFASHQYVDLAIAAARKAAPQWMQLSYDSRKQYLEKYALALEARKHDLKKAISMETGKPLWEAETEVQSMNNKIACSIAAYQERCQSKFSESNGIINATRHKPHGVVAVLGPFNFPGHLPNGHIVPALLAGNTVIFKPSELTPHVAELMMSCWVEAGLPPGVLNLIYGDKDIGSYLVAHKDLDGIFFTGSANVGLQIGASCINFPNRIIAL